MLVKSYSISPVRLQRIMEKALFLQFFLGLYYHPFHNLESGKRNCCFGESLEFWIQKFLRALYTNMAAFSLVWHTNMAAVTSCKTPSDWLHSTALSEVRLRYNGSRRKFRPAEISCVELFRTHEATLTVRKFRRLAGQSSVWTERKYWRVPCERSARSNFSAGRKFVLCSVNVAKV